MKYKGIQITIGMIFLVLGFMLSIQFKSIKTINAVGIGKMRAEELQVALSAEQAKLKNVLKELDNKDKKIEEYQNAASKNDTAIDVFKKDLEQAKILAGLNSLEGTGVTVTLSDSKLDKKRESQDDLNYFIIHDSDILLVINELRASGAEAISINDNRVLATSEIRCAGPTLSINNTKTSAPFEIKAIGDPTVIENALRMTGGVVDALEQWGIEIKISKQDKLVVPKFTGALTFKYATPGK